MGRRTTKTGPQETWDGAGRLTDERPPGIMVSLRFGPKLTVPWKKKNDSPPPPTQPQPPLVATREKEPVPKQGNKDPPPDSPLASDVAGFPVGMAMAHYNSLLSYFSSINTLLPGMFTYRCFIGFNLV